jgi:hypothetical protein
LGICEQFQQQAEKSERKESVTSTATGPPPTIIMARAEAISFAILQKLQS